MRKIIVLMVCAALLCGCAGKKTVSSVSKEDKTSPSVKDPEKKAEEVMAEMDLTSKVEQMILPSIQTWDGVPFTQMNDEVSDMLSRYHFGGIILFADNIVDHTQVIQLTQGMQKAAINNNGIPMFIGTDQEGGWIVRLADGTTMPGNMALAATGDPKNAEQSSEIMGKELQALGINMDFAPDLDVNSNPANPVIGVRSFSDDPDMVSEFGKAYLQGLKKNNVIGTIKHFPGHGNTDTDSHTGLPLVNSTKEELENLDLKPFKKLISENSVDVVMSAHIQYPQIETGTYTSIADGSQIYLPATLSHTMITDILRNEIGFQGVVITDSLLMDAIAENFSRRDAAKLAINAGVNMLLMPVDLNGQDAVSQMDAYINDIVDMVNDGEISEDSINDSVEKILTLKAKKGILDQIYDDANTKSMIVNASKLVGTEKNHQIERNIGDKGVTVLKNENGLLPYKVKENGNIVMISVSSDQKNVLEYGFSKLQKEGIILSDAHATVTSEEWGDQYQEAQDSIHDADLLVITSAMMSGNQIDFSQSPRIANIVNLIAYAKKQGIPVVAVSTGVPYDVPLLQQADAILCVYNSNGAERVDDDSVPRGTYSVNLLCGEDIIFGKASPAGKLPVNIPDVTNGSFTSNIMYERGTGITW